jgi:hypothetical protein
VGRHSGGGGDVLSNYVSLASGPSRWRRREVCGSGVVLQDFFWLGDHRISMKLHQQLFLVLHLRDGCDLLDPFGGFPSATNNVKPT